MHFSEVKHALLLKSLKDLINDKWISTKQFQSSFFIFCSRLASLYPRYQNIKAVKNLFSDVWDIKKHVLFWIIPFPLPIVNVELESIIGSDSMSVKLTSCPHVSDCIVMYLNEIFKRYLFCNFFCLLAKFATGSSQENKSIISNADQTCN